MTRFDAEILRSGEALEALSAEWDDLFRRAPRATPFQSPAWLLPWWRVFSPGEPRTAAVRRDGRLVGLAPFYREDGALGRRLLPLGISLSDYHDVLLDPACGPEAGAALVDAMGAEGFDVWSLEELPPDAAARELPAPPGCAEARAGQSACPVLAFEAGRDLAAALPRTKRRKLAMARNRSARRGEVAVEWADEATALGLLDDLFRLHGLRWESRGEPGVLADEAVRRFHLAALPGLQRSGLLRLFGLRIGGDRAAVYYGFGRGSRAYAYLSGLDPAYAFESPGTLLVAEAMEAALREGAREFHFLRGQEPYKYEWGAADRWNELRTFRKAAADAA